MGTIFVAGAYGAGKSTLCEQLSRKLKIPAFSAGDLISAVNGEVYGANKVVSNKINNQDILSQEVSKKLTYYPKIILAGHFCIFDKDNHVEHLPESVYSNIAIERIILLEAEISKILSNLSTRDGRQYSTDQIFDLLNAERNMSQTIANKIGCKLFIHNMQFDGTDVNCCLAYAKEGSRK